MIDRAWLEAVVAHCDPVFLASAAAFDPGRIEGPEALLWEADPRAFAAAYPDSDIVESYGEEQWPGVRCIDYWVYLRPAESVAELAVEGWNLGAEVLPMTGDAAVDAPALAHRFAEILRVGPADPGTQAARG